MCRCVLLVAASSLALALPAQTTTVSQESTTPHIITGYRAATPAPDTATHLYGATDSILTGPITVLLANPEPTDMGLVLEKDREYTVVVQGTGSIWSIPGTAVDALYTCSHTSLPPGQVKKRGGLQFTNPSGDFSEFVRITHGRDLPYNPAHMYWAVIKGEDKPFQVRFVETSMHNYADNSGAFSITVYPGPPKGGGLR